MTSELPEYHQRVAAANRQAILDAATTLFLELGYDRTSLARVSKDARVSKATLFKQFPTKAELFEAAVLAVGSVPGDLEPVELPHGDLHAGLVAIGAAYVELLAQPRVADLMRTLIAESPRFPELRERIFDFGTLPLLAELKRYLEREGDTGGAEADAPEGAATQFLGMIATAVFWPRLVHGGWSLDAEQTSRVVDEAARTIVARYGTR